MAIKAGWHVLERLGSSVYGGVWLEMAWCALDGYVTVCHGGDVTAGRPGQALRVVLGCVAALFGTAGRRGEEGHASPGSSERVMAGGAWIGKARPVPDCFVPVRLVGRAAPG